LESAPLQVKCDEVFQIGRINPDRNHFWLLSVYGSCADKTKKS